MTTTNKKKTYEVVLCRQMIQSCAIEIWAETPEEAKKIAYQQCYDADWDDEQPDREEVVEINEV